MQSWLVLIAAIVLEVSGTTSMKLSDGFTRLLPSVLLTVFYLFSLAALALALKRIDVEFRGQQRPLTFTGRTLLRRNILILYKTRLVL